MEDLTKQRPATVEDIRAIVAEAVEKAIQPLETRMGNMETELRNKVSAELVLKMIEASFNGLNGRVQEVHGLSISWDEHLRAVEKEFQKVTGRLESFQPAIDEIKRRLEKVEEQQQDAESELRSQRFALYGDASQKDGPPSLYAMIADMPNTVEKAIGPLVERVAAIEAENKDTRQFVTRRRLIERRFIEGATKLVKNPMLISLLWRIGIGAGVGVAIAEVLKILAGGA